MSSSVEGSPTDPLDASCREAATLVLPGSDWIHRRVQSIHYVEPELVQVRLSIDFTLPKGCVCSHVPITVLPKWPPLYRFDYQDAQGRSVPLLTSPENGAADWALMSALSEIALPSLVADKEYLGALELLTKGPETNLEDAFDAFFARISEARKTGPVDEHALERLVDLGAALTDSTLLWFPTGRCSGERMVAKLAYMSPAYSGPPLYQRVLRSLSWAQPIESLPLRHVGADASYHVELEAPPVLVIRDLDPTFWWLTDDPKEAGQDSEESTKAAEEAGLRPDQHFDYEGRFAHVYISGRRPMGAELFYRFAPARNGFIAAALLSSLLVAIFATLLYLERGALSRPGDLDGSVALLALVPALIGYFVFRPSDPPLVRRYLLGVQALAMLSALVPLVMAGFLLIYRDSGNKLHSTWHWSMIATWVFVALLGVSFLRAGTRDRPEHE
jgi:hypothetical protein